MFLRQWDPDAQYPDGLIRIYRSWVLEISYRQHTLGCMLIFARRAVPRIASLTNDELTDLRHVIREIEFALGYDRRFAPDHLNYLQLGNVVRWLHFQCIPRYAGERSFAGRTWNDDTWGGPPSWVTVDADRVLVRRLRDAIVHAMPVCTPGI